VTQADDTRAGGVRTGIGLVLIVGVVPVYFAAVSGHRGWWVVAAGVVALVVLVAGIGLAGGWLGVFQRRRENPREQQQGCLQLLVTLIALLAGAIILYYVVYYGAGAYLRGELGVLLP
jgi:hypothetical protein